jgi:hypothetical protein
MVKKIRTYFHSDKFPRWFKILNLSLLLPIILWPFIFFTTIFFFDNPSNLITTFFFFFLVNAYPLYLITLVLLNAKLYTWNRFLGLLLPATFLITIITGAVYLSVRISERLKQQEQEVIEKEANGELGSGYFKKNNLIYYRDSVVIGADPATFDIVSGTSGRWTKDKNSCFYLGKLRPNVDSKTFIYLDYDYAKDKNHVYYRDKIIESADAKTFKHYDGTQDGEDKNGCYHFGEKMSCDSIVRSPFEGK